MRKENEAGALKALIRASAFVSGAAILAMMLVTCADVIGRRIGFPLQGAYDIVRLVGGVAIATALPLTTAVKGHVAIEYFFHRLGPGGRAAVDALMRTLQTGAFLFAAFAFYRRGVRLFLGGEATPTLRLPIFWLAWLVAAMCLLTAFISLYHLLRPGRELR